MCIWTKMLLDFTMEIGGSLPLDNCYIGNYLSVGDNFSNLN